MADTINSERISGGRIALKEHEVTKIGAWLCGNCGFIMLFSARMMGLR